LKSPLPEAGYEEGEIPDEKTLSKQLYAGVSKIKDSIMTSTVIPASPIKEPVLPNYSPIKPDSSISNFTKISTIKSEREQQLLKEIDNLKHQLQNAYTGIHILIKTGNHELCMQKKRNNQLQKLTEKENLPPDTSQELKSLKRRLEKSETDYDVLKKKRIAAEDKCDKIYRNLKQVETELKNESKQTDKYKKDLKNSDKMIQDLKKKLDIAKTGKKSPKKRTKTNSVQTDAAKITVSDKKTQTYIFRNVKNIQTDENTNENFNNSEPEPSDYSSNPFHLSKTIETVQNMVTLSSLRPHLSANTKIYEIFMIELSSNL